MLRHAMDRVLVVGSGLTGAVTAALCRQNLPSTPEIFIWDKSQGAGGRMSTSRCPSDKNCTADLGAQYITLSKQYTVKRTGLYQDLVENGVLSPMQGKMEGDNSAEGSQHFVTPKGVSSLVKYYLGLSEANVEYSRTVNRIDYSKSNGKDIVKVSTNTGECEDFDAVILTLPVPQLLQLQGDINKTIENSGDIKQNLEQVTYSSRFALGLFYDKGTKLNYDWCAKYFPNHECIRYVSIDTKKRGIDNEDTAPSVVVHTNVVPFGLKYLETDKEEVGPIVLKHLHTLLPDLPQPNHVKNHKWRYSQVHKPYAGKEGCIVLQEKPLVIVGGDGFTHSGFDGCVDSAESIINSINKLLNKDS
ncbi:hypothetical protein SNE40_020431 [Patella caerulea]|uniref:Amine oxidase domain-containing protein n=2 Tax=Patella caerulea TaxID=87958 RepID=A0AAN8G2T1_PATCE